MGIIPLETKYNGYRFRSRLEARWANFFDESGIEYLYEPAGFALKNGVQYLPDFYLTKQRTWVEIKFDVLDDFDFEKAQQLVLESEVPLIILDSDPQSRSFTQLYLDEEGDVMSRKVNLVPKTEDSFLEGALLDGDEEFLLHGYDKQVDAAKKARNNRFGVFE